MLGGVPAGQEWNEKVDIVNNTEAIDEFKELPHELDPMTGLRLHIVAQGLYLGALGADETKNQWALDVGGRLECSDLDGMSVLGAYMQIPAGAKKDICVEAMTFHPAGNGGSIGTLWVDTSQFITNGYGTVSETANTYKHNLKFMTVTFFTARELLRVLSLRTTSYARSGA